MERFSLLLGVSMVVAAPAARADIYTYTDENGVVHFTNIPRRGKKGRRWKILFRTGPGKARSVRGCRRCDKVRARDRSSRRRTRYDEIIREACRLYSIPLALAKAVISVESDFDPRVVSSAGAMGLMQLMPATAKAMGVTDPFDPRQNIFGGVRYLRVLANMFNGDLLLTLAAYHAGPKAVIRYRGLPPYATTQKYVQMVLTRYYHYRRLAQSGP